VNQHMRPPFSNPYAPITQGLTGSMLGITLIARRELFPTN
jgi:hypothetical protein